MGEDPVERQLRRRRPRPRRVFVTQLGDELAAEDAATRRPPALRRVIATYLICGMVLLVLAVIAALAWTGSASASTFTTGFADGLYLEPGRDTWYSRTARAGAGVVLLPVAWGSIAPDQPARPTDPADPGYRWTNLDAAVRGAATHHLAIALTVAGGGGPGWADGPHRPPGAQPGTWRPSTAAFGAFATALARRYSGGYLTGGVRLPRVRYFQAWSEPNLPNHLTPQWVRRGRDWFPASPGIYRGLLNALYAAVKAVHPSNLVITGGTAPFGDPPGGGNARMPPAEFVRELLCLHGRQLVAGRCQDPAHFDLLAHHPYAIGGPTLGAFGADDVSLPDLAKLTRPLRSAERRGLALPHKRHGLWVTEFSWDTDPPDPHGVPDHTRAVWAEQAFHELWQAGVSVLAWFLVRDQAPVPDYASTYQSGWFLRSGQAKPYLEAFRFPFLLTGFRHGRAGVWGVAPWSGVVSLQVAHGRLWTTVARLRVRARHVFMRSIALRRGGRARALLGTEASLPWRA